MRGSLVLSFLALADLVAQQAPLAPLEGYFVNLYQNLLGSTQRSMRTQIVEPTPTPCN
jgi:hypothetical protein